MAEKTVTKIDKNEITYNAVKNRTTKEQLQRDYGYFIAQKLLKAMLDKGLISIDEFNKITAENRKTFSPYLAEIMP